MLKIAHFRNKTLSDGSLNLVMNPNRKIQNKPFKQRPVREEGRRVSPKLNRLFVNVFRL